MKLYKYRSIKSLGNKEIFEESKVYLSRSQDFNDPFDCRPVLKTNYSHSEIEEYIQHLSQTHLSGLPNNDRRRQENEVRERFNSPEELQRIYYSLLNSYGIYSLSSTYSNILLWSHYSDKHKGFCIEFDSGNNDPPFPFTWKVVYSDQRALVDMMLTRDDDSHKDLFTRGILTKAVDWAYELEWRFVHLRHVGYFKFSEQILSKVILGARISDEDTEKVRAWALARSSPVKIWKARLSNRVFGLEFEELTS